MTPTQLEKRFHDLLVKDIKGETSPSEKRKLDILERMRSDQITDQEKKAIVRMEWRIRELRKITGRINRTAKGVVPPKTK